MARTSGKAMVPVKRYERSTAGVQEMIFDEIEKLQTGESNAQQLRSICSATNAILAAARLELEAAKHMYQNDAPTPDTPLQLGRDRERGE